MNVSPESGSLRSNSDSSSISEESSGDVELFPRCGNFHFTRKLSEAKFPVYLVSSHETNQAYVIKIFPWEDNAPSDFFIKEIRFSHYSHPHIISMFRYEFDQESSSTAHSKKISYILMEYAKYGDFFDVLISYKVNFEEILLRTYFHQLIEALETLHANGSAHLDIKLENLLLAEDFSMKITDFDLSYMPEDGKVKTRGTKNFRAPEMYKGICTNPKAADVYSAGIILFLMKTGGLVPYKEPESPEEEGDDLEQADSKAFWEKQAEFLGDDISFFSEDFRSLFAWMTRPIAAERPSLAQVKSSRWYKKKVYSKKDLYHVMSAKFTEL